MSKHPAHDHTVAPHPDGWAHVLRQPPPPVQPAGLVRKAGAAQVAGQLTPRGQLWGLTSGQWSLLDLLRELQLRVPPARWSLSTWTVGKAEIDCVAWLLGHREIVAVRWLLDRGFWSTAYATEQQLPQRLIGFFGADCVVATHNHAKFATLRGPGFDLAVLTSMNLNANRRVETFAIADDAGICDMLDGVIEELQSRLPSRGLATPGEVHQAWAGLCHGTPAPAFAGEWAAIQREPRPPMHGAVRHDDQAPGGGGTIVGDASGRTATHALADRLRARRAARAGGVGDAG